MKVKDYLKKVEVANEVVTGLMHGDSYGSREIYFYMEYEGYKFYKAKTYKEFVKILKEEFIPEFYKKVLEQDFELDTEYIIDTSSPWWKCESKVEFSIEMVL